MKSGNRNFLEPSGPLQACNGSDCCYVLNMVYETTKLTQQSVGTVTSTDGHTSVLALNARPNISVCCAVYMPGPSAYQLHSHYHYHHSSLLLLVLFRYQLPSPLCCPTLSTHLTTCVSLRGTHTFSLAPCASPCVQPRP
jgi:hypothetical protein